MNDRGDKYKVQARGAALPWGIMMAVGRSAGVATADAAGMIHSASFHAFENRITIKGLRALGSIGASLGNSTKAFAILARLRKQSGMLEKDIISVIIVLAWSFGYLGGCAYVRRQIGDRSEIGDAFCALLYLMLLSVSPMGKRVRVLHGAEHQTIHCTDQGISPIPENASRQSPLHSRCGTALVAGMTAIYGVSQALLLPWLSGWIREAVNGLLVGGAFGLSYEAIVGDKSKLIRKLGRVFQYLTTAPADSEALEVASAALFAAMEPDGRE